MKNLKLKLVLFVFLFFTFFTSSAFNYYWVGGTGNWNDLNHWATTSGGNIFHLEIPTALDNVFFDANSFSGNGQSVNINVETAYCNDIDWTGVMYSPEFNSASSVSLKIWGSLVLSENMKSYLQGIIEFKSTTKGKKIKSSGQQYYGDIVLNGSGGEWVLQDSLYSSGSISHINGIFRTNDLKITVKYYATGDSRELQELDLGSSVFTVSGLTFYNNYDNDLILNAVTSTIRCTSGGGINVTNRSKKNLNFNNIELLDKEWGGSIWNASEGKLFFNKVTFYGNGEIYGNNVFNDVTFYKDGDIEGKNTFNEQLHFEAGKTYKLSDILTLGKDIRFSATGNCKDLITIQNNEKIYPAVINCSSGKVTVSFVELRGIIAKGGAEFIADNSLDMGDNSGWSINTFISRDFFWVGGTGNWSDGSHWATSSGGPGSGCIPTPVDNVFFDAKSFNAYGQSVTIDSPFARCNSMDWTDAGYNPVFNSSFYLNNLHIWGSLTLNSNMNFAFDGNTYFESEIKGRKIKMAGQQFKSYVFFTGNGGEWILSDAFNCNKDIYHSAGILNTNNQEISCNTYDSGSFEMSLFPRSLVLGSSLFKAMDFICEVRNNFTINAGTSTIRMIKSSKTIPSGFVVLRSAMDFVFYNVEFEYKTNGILCNGSQHLLIFNNITFLDNGIIQGNNLINGTLTFSEGKLYTLDTNCTQSFGMNANIVANGNCSNRIKIQSSDSRKQALLNKVSGNIILNYCILKGVKADGGATFTSNNTVDLGNNEGWIFDATHSKNYYWVGGSGNWSDGTHWALSSGGQGSGCIPTELDNVYFDINSFDNPNQTVNVDVEIAYCHDMDWTGAKYNPEFTKQMPDDSLSIEIYGSFTLIKEMLFLYSGKIYFKSNSKGETITLAEHSFNEEVYFDGVGGEWTLQDDFRSSRYITHYRGDLITNNKTIFCGYFSPKLYWYNDNQARSLTLGASLLMSGVNIESDNDFKLNSGTSTVFNDLKIVENSNKKNLFVFNNVIFPDTNSTGFIRNVYNYGGYLFFNNVTFFGDGVIRGNNVIKGNLTFSAGKTYIFSDQTKQFINGNWIIPGTCNSYILLRSTYFGDTSKTFVTVRMKDGKIDCYNVHMQGIHLEGGGIFNAYHSVDLGQNKGWNFSDLPPLGNTGNIAGKIIVTKGQKGVYYSIQPVIGAFKYIWTVPPGASIIYGQGDTLIKVDFGDNAVSGDITVYSYNGCGRSPVNSILGIYIGEQGNLVTTGDTICIGSTASISVKGGNTYSWSNGLGSDSIISVHPTVTTTYLVTSTDANLNTNIASAIVMVNPLPKVDFTINPQEIFIHDTLYFNSFNAKDVNIWKWDFGDGFSTDDKNKTKHKYQESGKYKLKLTVISPSGCSIEVEKFINIISNSNVWIPSAFTPNGDGINDVLNVLGEIKSIHMEIYNQWGILVFISDNLQLGWDGKYKGIDQPIGNYTYVIRLINFSDREVIDNGTITLLR